MTKKSAKSKRSEILGDFDQFLIGEGQHQRLWNVLGAHVFGKATHFAVWAPNARAVSVVGDFNADPTVAAFIPPPVGGVVRGNHATQQGGGLLDYSITNAFGYNFVAAGMLLGASDHFPQNFSY